MKAYVNKFIKSLRYVPYIRDEKLKTHRFLNGFPQYYHDWIEFDEPKMREDTIKKAKCYYDHSKHRIDYGKDGEGRRRLNLGRND